MPSFLYAMPMEGGRRVFLEETCLVAKPALPFAVLKRRLQRRLAASGIKVHVCYKAYGPQHDCLCLSFRNHRTRQ